MIGLVYGIFFCGFFSSHGYICFAILHSTICFRLAGKVETAYSDLLEQFKLSAGKALDNDRMLLT